MNLYLVQHGDALPKEVDPDRSLSESGRLDVQRMALFLNKTGLRVARIMHSGKKRAEQTAELLAASVSPGAKLEQVSGIDPLDPTNHLVGEIRNWNERTMVVGHLPYMSKLVSRLVVGNEAITTVVFTPGTLVCLERSEDGSFSVAWMLRPHLLGGSDSVYLSEKK